MKKNKKSKEKEKKKKKKKKKKQRKKKENNKKKNTQDVLSFSRLLESTDSRPCPSKSVTMAIMCVGGVGITEADALRSRGWPPRFLTVHSMFLRDKSRERSSAF